MRERLAAGDPCLAEPHVDRTGRRLAIVSADFCSRIDGRCLKLCRGDVLPGRADLSNGRFSTLPLRVAHLILRAPGTPP